MVQPLHLCPIWTPRWLPLLSALSSRYNSRSSCQLSSQFRWYWPRERFWAHPPFWFILTEATYRSPTCVYTALSKFWSLQNSRGNFEVWSFRWQRWNMPFLQICCFSCFWGWRFPRVFPLFSSWSGPAVLSWTLSFSSFFPSICGYPSDFTDISPSAYFEVPLWTPLEFTDAVRSFLAVVAYRERSFVRVLFLVLVIFEVVVEEGPEEVG